MARWVRRSVEWLLALVLIFAGLAGAIHEVLHRVGIQIEHQESFTLRIVGLLALALGLERFTRFAHVERHFSSLEKQLNTIRAEMHERLTVAVVEGHDHVFNEAIKLFQTAESSIRTLVFAKGPTAPEHFLRALVEHLKERPLLTYHVTVAVDLSTMNPQLWELIDKRNEGYREGGVADRVQITVLDTTKPVGFDVMVVDDKHCAMALSAVPVPDLNKEVAIHIENQPRVVKRIRAWLENLTPQLISLEDARKKSKKKLGRSSASH